MLRLPARTTIAAVLLGSCCFLLGAAVEKEKNPITSKMIAAAEQMFGLRFTAPKREMMRNNVNGLRKNYEALRAVPLPNNVPPAILFNPLPVGFQAPAERRPIRWTLPGRVLRPAQLDDAAFFTIGELAELIRTRQVTSVELTQMYLARLKKYGPKLECVVTLTEELALRQAREADAEIAAGHYRGMLHGIPYGAKDLLAVKGYPTTWGSVPYKDQVIDEDAAVIVKLREAGAVLVAKLTMGELAWGDVWFGGTTRNPWNYEQGSSGSSAGSASATSAGLVPFAIGTETWGSIISPSTRCGVTGLRPTYGRVSRSGAMALSWSMDKIGPICRAVEDCGIVFNAILGPDGKDQTVYDYPFNYAPDVDLSRLRIGYLSKDFEKEVEDDKRKTEDELDTSRANDQAALSRLRDLGAALIPVELPALPVNDFAFILDSEAAAAFDELTRTGKDDLMKRQIENAWPNVFRVARMIPAVEYIQANRARFKLIREMDALMQKVDVFVAPSVEGDTQLVTNLTGHPCVAVPNGFTAKGAPTSISVCGKLFDEGTVLVVARRFQEATDHHRKHPQLKE